MELQLPAYATATATPDPSLICDLHNSSGQHRILNPLSEARDRTRDLMVPSRICSPQWELLQGESYWKPLFCSHPIQKSSWVLTVVLGILPHSPRSLKINSPLVFLKLGGWVTGTCSQKTPITRVLPLQPATKSHRCSPFQENSGRVVILLHQLYFWQFLFCLRKRIRM